MKKYHLLHPSEFALDGGAMYGIIPRPLWQTKSIPDEKNRIRLSLRLVLIETDQKKILIDTGIGDYHQEKFNKIFKVQSAINPIEACLNKIQLNCNDITDLVLSHLHFDHAGGVAKSSDGKFTPVFPNAKLHLHQDHYNYAIAPTLRDSGSFHSKVFNPIIDYYKTKGAINWIQCEEGEIIPEANLCFKSSHGHTPHMIHPHDENFIYLADIVPTSHHVPIPWVMGYDIAPGVSTEDKARILKFTYENNLKIIFEHDPDFWGCSLQSNEKKHLILKDSFESHEEIIHEIKFQAD
jgi:glyoxylase-like metal-dependent hydrolase (beta-lactamase superfamily II)